MPSRLARRGQAPRPADLFDMQDEIVARLANQLGTQLIAAEARRGEKAPHPDSMDLYFQGMARLNKGSTAEFLAQAHRFFERALALDPGNIEALVGMATVDRRRGAGYLTDDRAARFAAAEATLIKALSLAPNHAVAHHLLGTIQISTKRAPQGMAECERARSEKIVGFGALASVAPEARKAGGGAEFE
jgi:hypothetical protein